MILRKARLNNYYELFKPYLAKVIYYTKQMAKIRNKTFGLFLYDALIDQFDHGNTAKIIRQTFDILKKYLPPLIKQIVKKQESQKNS